ncbi:toxin-antitoxin system YwqK family antitoxin [Polaribacter sp.]|nr:toxin-antitoxin system YwqK family antitoxin [Polaribacter sp.]
MIKFRLAFLLTFIFLINCSKPTLDKENKNKTIATIVIDSLVVLPKDSLVLNGNEGNWYYKNQLFNGFAVQYYPNKNIKEKTGFFNGKKQGVYKVYYPDGVLKLKYYYNQNTITGSYKSWWQNGNLASEVNYTNGKMHGIEKKWYADGNISKERNLVDGKENGLQRAWLNNGKIYVNYEAKNGRVFGMKRASLCYQLNNENVVEKKK